MTRPKANPRVNGSCKTRPGLPDDRRSPWSTTVGDWQSFLDETGKAATTVEGYAKHVGWLAGDLAAEYPDPWNLTPDAFANWLDAQEWSATTRQRVLVSLRSFYTWGVTTGECRRSPLSGVSVAPTKTRGPEVLKLPPAWIEPMAGFQTWLRAKGQSPGTVEHRRSQVSRFAHSHSDPWAVTLDDLTRWLSRVDWAPGYKRAVRAALRSFYRWAEIYKRIAESPARDLDPVRRARALPRPATDDAVMAGLDAADDRTRLAIEIAIYAGMRRFEIAKVHSQDIGDDSLRVLGKSGHERFIPLHPELASMLRAEIRRRREGRDLASGWGPHIPPENGWLFPSDDSDRPMTAQHLGKLITRAMPDGWTAHTLRHRFATQAYRVDRDLRAVQELLGHASPTTTAVYAAVPDGALTAAVMGVGFAR
jgi:site-specific recombinase XerD